MKNIFRYIIISSIVLLSHSCNSDREDIIEKSMRITNAFYKNSDEFALTYDKAGATTPTIRNQAFNLYKKANWPDLEILFKENNLNNG